MSTRREGLEEALSALEANTLETPSLDQTGNTVDETVLKVDESADKVDESRSRDESGRFTRKEAIESNADAQKLTADAQKPAGDVQTTPVEEIQRPEPPKSWKPEKRAVWDKLDADTAAYLHQREQEQAKGFEEYRAAREPLYKEIEPYIAEIRQNGGSPEAVTRDLFYTFKLLRSGDEGTRLQTLVNVAHSVGIPLQQMLQQSAALPQHMQQHIDPAVMAANQRARNAELQANQLQAQQQAEANAAAVAQVEAFKQTHPHVDELATEMQRLLQTGLASDLESAYSKALRLNDKLFEQTQAQQREAAEKQRRIEADKAAKAAKANAVSTRSATPGTAANGVAPKGRRAALEDAFENISANRI
ncbi:hypothetical protein [Caballeronia sp. ATUFL_M1_KS5A]|uniref:hypothetical protein n=1 Tax=Caballeronia sp. ATUFL_M1_KS5A TaxID=2921778 RepID=UPI0020278C10|nr:hypothetical protein [Caballeronia sp. ATUFL_M1_KS5A]